MADSQGEPRGLRLTATHVYWTNYASTGGEVRRRLLDGGTVETMSTGNSAPLDVDVSDTRVCWTNYAGGQVRCMAPQPQSTVDTVANMLASPAGMAVDGTHVFWALNNGNGKIQSRMQDGSGVTTDIEVGQQTPFNVVLKDGDAWWGTAGGKVCRHSKDGTGNTTCPVTGEGQLFEIAVDGTHVYWISGGVAGRIRRMALGGGAVEDVVGNLSTPLGLAVDGDRVCWTEYVTTGRVACTGLTGGTVHVVAEGQNKPWSVRLNATHVYWTESLGGAVRRAPRP